MKHRGGVLFSVYAQKVLQDEWTVAKMLTMAFMEKAGKMTTVGQGDNIDFKTDDNHRYSIGKSG